MRLLISGAGGFVGRHLATALSARGHAVTALIHRARPAGLERCVEMVGADLAGEDALPGGPFDALVHCAAALPSAVADDGELTRINVDGGRRLFRHAIGCGVTIVIFCSSMAVYGQVEAAMVAADTPLRNAAAYGRAKRECERLLDELSGARPALRAVSLRLPGVIGAGSHHNFLSDTMARLMAGEPVVVRNPEAAFNNVVHVADLAPFVETLLASLPPGHRVAPLAAADPLPISAVVDILAAEAGGSGAVHYEQGGRPFLISNHAALALGYRPATVEDSVRRFARDAMAAREDRRTTEG